jgi:hypothetical protein
MTAIWDRIKDLATDDAEKYLWVQIPKERTDATYDDTALKAERSYIRLFVAEMFLSKSRTWFKTWYPAVQVATQLKFGDQPKREFSRLAQPPQNATETGVLQNYEIMPTTPFNGGTVEIEAALLAMQGTNHLSTAISLLQDFSSLVGPPMAQAITIAEKVSNGVDKLYNASNGNVDLPYHDTFVGAGMGDHVLRPGYIAIIKATAGQVKEALLTVKGGCLHYPAGDDDEPQSFRSYDYVLLRLDGFEKRDDYMSLSEIAKPYNDFIDALENDRDEDAEAAKRSALAAARKSADLARFDRRRVVDALKADFQAIEQDLGYAAVGEERRTLDHAMDTWAMTMDQAEAKGDVWLAEIT